jgi:parallel beta-helix repeat protein
LASAALGLASFGLAASGTRGPVAAHAADQVLCPVLILTNTTLNSDCLAPVAIIIGADGVTFNGGGHTVDCAGGGTGISLVNRTAVRVTNMTIIHCGIGIDVIGGGSHVFDTNLNIQNNPGCPPSPGGGTGFPRVGLRFVNSSGSHIKSSNISCNRIGVDFSDSGNNTIDSSAINDNIDCCDSSGVQLNGISRNNVITSTDLLRNGHFGVAAFCCTTGNTTIQSSNIKNTHFAGGDIGVALSSSGNSVRANTIDGNDGVGVFVSAGSTGNTIASNEALGNTGVDLADGNLVPPCDSNDWNNNRFGTANQSCIH